MNGEPVDVPTPAIIGRDDGTHDLRFFHSENERGIFVLCHSTYVFECIGDTWSRPGNVPKRQDCLGIFLIGLAKRRHRHFSPGLFPWRKLITRSFVHACLLYTSPSPRDS